MTEEAAVAAAVKPRGSLTRRLIWLAAIWSLIALLIAGGLLTTAFRDTAVRRLDASIEASDREVVAVTRVVDGQVITPQIQDARTLRALSGKYWSVVEPASDGGVRPLTRSESLFDAVLPLPAEGLRAALGQPGQPYLYDAEGPDGEQRLRVMAVARTLPDREAPVIFLTALDRRQIDEDAENFALLTWTALALMGAGLVGAVFIQVRVGLRPLYDLGQEIAEVRKGRAQRLGRSYPREIAPLAEELNALLDHNQEVVERQRTHVGNLAHALKTPLAVMLAEAGSGECELAETVRRQAAVMKGQVDHHLQRARAAARAQGTGQSTPVEEVLDELAVLLERVFQDKGVEIDWRAEDGLCFRGERQDFQEMLGNLMENACKWAKGRVRVKAEAAGDGRMTVTVEDDGPGLPADQRDAALKRGARLDEAAPGSGLGLSIVDELARSYGGRVELGTARLGGLSARLELPRVEA